MISFSGLQSDAEIWMRGSIEGGSMNLVFHIWLMKVFCGYLFKMIICNIYEVVLNHLIILIV